MPALRTSRFQIGDNWPVLVFLGLLAILVILKGRFTPFDVRSLTVNARPSISAVSMLVRAGSPISAAISAI